MTSEGTPDGTPARRVPRFREPEVADDDWTATLRSEQVVEIAFDAPDSCRRVRRR